VEIAPAIPTSQRHCGTSTSRTRSCGKRWPAFGNGGGSSGPSASPDQTASKCLVRDRDGRLLKGTDRLSGRHNKQSGVGREMSVPSWSTTGRW